MERIVIPGELPSLNEILDAAKSHYHKYNRMKKDYTRLVQMVASRLPHYPRVKLDITWYCKDRRRDPDNIAAAVKFIWDGLVAAGVIENDGWAENGGWSNSFEIDKNNPRVEITIKEVEQPPDRRG